MSDFIDPDELEKGRAKAGVRRTAPKIEEASSNFVDPDEVTNDVTSERKSGQEELRDMSVPRQIASGTVGAFQAPLSMLSTIPAMVAGGARGAAALATGDDWETA